MTKTDLEKLIMVHPSIRKIIKSGALTAQEVKEGVSAFADIAVDKASMRNTYAFLLKEGSTTSTSGTSDYTLDHQDAQDVIWVTYGSSDNLLYELDMLDAKRILSNRSGTIPVFGWQAIASNDGIPTIRLIGTPSSTGKAIEYAYRKRDITISEWPSSFGYVLVSETLGMLLPEFKGIADADAAMMASDYDKGPPPRGNAQLDSQMMNNNIRRNRKFGMGGLSETVVIESNS